MKSHQPTRLGSVSEPARDGLSRSLGTHIVAQHAVVLSKKRSRPEGGPVGVIDGGWGNFSAC